jgi:hypothetical protein
MTTVEFIVALYCQVDAHMHGLPKHPQATLWPSEVVTLGLLHALKGVGNRAFYRWLTRDHRALFPRLPERTRLFRLFMTHQAWTDTFLASPTVLGVIDTYGIELIHPIREGRSPRQIGRKGLSNHRWIVGGKVCLLLNQWGLVVAWECATANVSDQTFQPLIRQFEEQMIVLSDTAFHAAEGDPTTSNGVGGESGMTACSSRRCCRCSPWSAISKRSCTGSGSIFTHGSLAPWRLLICWYNGMAYPQMSRASYLSRLLSLVCKILAPLINSS